MICVNLRLLVVAATVWGLQFPSSAWANVWPSKHERVARALSSDDVGQRRAAAKQLMDVPPKMARAFVDKALRDTDVEVRVRAANVAIAIGLPKAGDRVISWLSAREERLREIACKLIAASPTPASVSALGRVLGDAKADVRLAAATAMGLAGGSEAVAPLLGHLDDPAVAVRFEVVRALGRIGDRRAVVPLVGKLRDQEAQIRREAARSLGRLSDPRAVATLMLALQDGSSSVQVASLDALGILRAGEATAAIAAMLKEDEQGVKDQAVRSSALAALGRIGQPRAIKLLVRELEREGPLALGDARGRAAAREALLLAGDAARPAVRETLESSRSSRLVAACALLAGKMKLRDSLPAILRAARRGTLPLDVALQAIREMADSRALAFVLEQLAQADPVIRRELVLTATSLLDPAKKDGRVVDVIRNRVSNLSTPLGERIALVRLLGKTGAKRALVLLLELAANKSPPLKTSVMTALGMMRHTAPEVDRILLEGISHASATVRMAAAKALAQVGGETAARVMLSRLEQAADQDRDAIGLAISAALGRAKNEGLVKKVKALLPTVPVTVRDALIEGLGRMDTAASTAALVTLSKSVRPDDRRKVAEALAGHPRAIATLYGLAKDPDPAVRANAVWSLGRIGSSQAVNALLPLLNDIDVTVAGNAAVASGRAEARSQVKNALLGPALCKKLTDVRSAVRANALVGLRAAGKSCGDGAQLRRLLATDPSWRVRVAVADLLHEQKKREPNGLSPLERRALARCAHDDRHASAAARCEHGHRQQNGTDDVLLFVIPDGSKEPQARTPFALLLADGAMRLGVTDRRGVVFEQAAPRGRLELAVPAALAD